jgi:hypothetical protein
MLHKWDGPLLEGFRKHSMVGVSEGLLNNAPCLVPLQALDIHQDSLKLRNGERWVGVVELNGDLVGEFLPGALALLETSHDIVERSGAPEVLLLQAKLFTTVKVVVGVEDSRNSLSTLLISYGALVLARVELLEVEFAASSLASPET